MTDDEVIAGLSERDVVALTIYGEARSEAIEGRLAVANVIRNRVKARRPAFGLSHRDVCLKPWQFSSWKVEGGAPNFELMMLTARHLTRPADSIIGPMLRECLWIADGLLGWQFTDNVHGATHYLTATLYATKAPAWTVGHQPACTIGAHLFFAGIA